MIITCWKCNTSFQIDISWLKPKGTKVKCSKCGHMFKAYPYQTESVAASAWLASNSKQSTNISLITKEDYDFNDTELSQINGSDSKAPVADMKASTFAHEIDKALEIIDEADISLSETDYESMHESFFASEEEDEFLDIDDIEMESVKKIRQKFHTNYRNTLF